jgi:hypothetical protein
MNAVAFGMQANGNMMIAAGALLGAAIPALVFCLTKIGAAMYVDVHGRA